MWHAPPRFVLDLLILLLGHERVIPFEIVFIGRFQGVCLHREVSLVEVVLPPFSVDHALALFELMTTPDSISDPQVDSEPVDALVSSVSRDDPLPSETEEEALTRLVR